MKNILIVEDNTDIRELLKLSIEMDGYTVNTAANGQEALETLSKLDPPCLILLDLMMPIMDGWKFVEELEKDKRLNSIPYVLLTAYAESGNDIKNARAIIKKPIDFEILNSTLKNFCTNKT